MNMLFGSIYMLIIIAVVTGMAVLVFRGSRTIYNNLYLGCQAAVLLWCSSQLLALLADGQDEVIVANIVGNTGICLIGTFWILFSITYSKARGKLLSVNTKIVGAAAICISLFHFICILTNQIHHMYYKTFEADNVVHGVFFFSNVVYTYLCVVIGCIFIYVSMHNMRKHNEIIGKICMVSAVLLPTIANVFYVTGLNEGRTDITPMAFGISSVLVLCATLRYKFLDVNVAAFDAVVAGLEDGVVIFDKDGSVTYCNKAFEGFGIDNTNILSILKWWEGLDSDNDMSGENGLTKVKCYDGKYYSKECYQLTDNKMVPVDDMTYNTMAAVVFKDVTMYCKLLKRSKELAIANEELALSKERNEIAQKVHDTVGHTLTMISSLLKLASVNDDNEEYLTDAREQASGGIKELRESINRLKQEDKFELVTQLVMHLANQVKEIEVSVTVQGNDSREYSHLSKIIYDCFRETITNCLKYANASKMDVVLRFAPEYVEMVIADDGDGCEVIKDNNGLSGIRKRVEEVNGKVKFVSGSGEGFLTRIRLCK